MKWIHTSFTIIALTLILCVPTMGDEVIGYDVVKVSVGGKYEILCGVWYPAAGGNVKAVYDFGTARVEGTAVRNAPPKRELGPLPVVLYSHGYSGCSHSSTFLTESLAKSGFIVIAPDHTDDLKACSPREDFVRESGYVLKLIKNASRLSRELSSGSYDAQFFKYRYMEVSAAIDWIVDAGNDPESPFYRHVDSEKIGAVGHSLGAYSVLATSGIVDTAYDSRIAAIVAMSGPGDRIFSCDDMAGVKIPTMLMYGEKESRRKELGLDLQFRCLSKPKFILVISGGDHLTFADSFLRRMGKEAEGKRHDIIVRYVGAFFEYFILNKERAKGVLKGPALGLDSYDFVF